MVIKYTVERNGVVIEKEIPVDFISDLVDRGKNAGAFIVPRYPFAIAEIPEDSHNLTNGLVKKDIITAINGTPVTYYDQVKTELSKYKGQTASVTVKRNGASEQLSLQVSEEGKIGAIFGALSLSDLEKLGYYKRTTLSYSFAEAIPAGTKKAWTTLTGYIKQLKKIFNPSTGAYKGLGGFISIGSIFPSEFSWETFWNITAFLSIMLGFMNLLPIPALDGGHVVFTLWEMITGRKPGDKFLEYAQVAGFIFLIALLLFANGNDIFRLFK